MRPATHSRDRCNHDFSHVPVEFSGIEYCRRCGAEYLFAYSEFPLKDIQPVRWREGLFDAPSDTSS